jgi:NitT/TauT family transport system substrate-binding protein
MNTWKRAGAATFAMLLLCVPQARAADTLPVVHVSTTLNDSGAEVYYGIEKGFFEKAGLDVQIVPLNSAGLLGPSVASGAIDIGNAGVIVIAAAHEHHLPFVIVAPAGLYSSKSPTGGLVVAKDSPMKTGSDLNGKTIGIRDVNSPAYIATKAWIDQNGGDSRTVKFIEVPDSAAVAAIGQKRIDAATIAEPDLDGAIHGTDVRSIAPVYDALGARFLLGAYFTTSAYVKTHPEIIRAFTKALLQTAQWANDNQAESAQILEKYTKTHVGPTMPRVVYGERLDASLVQPFINAAAKYGALAAPFPAAELFAFKP